MTTWEQLIVHALRHEPALCRVEGLTEKFFTSDDYRNLFSAISEIFEEEGADGPIDLAILSNKSGVAIERIGAIEAGCYYPTGNNFRDWIRAQQQENGKRELMALFVKEAEVYVKTGTLDSANVARLEELFATLKDQGNGSGGAYYTRLSTVEEKDIRWLWGHRIPLGMLTAFASVPGEGKSYVMTWLAAQLSRGHRLPDDPGAPLKGGTIFLSAEDPMDVAIKPRARANGADETQLYVLNQSTLSIEDGIGKVRRLLAEDKGIKLVVLDPITSYLGPKTDWLADPSVRIVLQPLVDLAAEKDLAVVIVGHYNKKQDSSLIHRMLGATAFAGLPRSILGIGHHQDDRERRFLFSVKMNYARRPEDLAFKIQPDKRLEFEDETVKDLDPEELVGSQKKGSTDANSFSAKWLRETLAAGSMDFAEIREAAKRDNLSIRTVQWAAGRIGVKQEPHGFGKEKTSTWSLP